ncbi:MAG: 4Fe-4S cluster-binding domain-containing protein, partial [Oscillospiraceae bacterium]|nr:4Fe-4S cluster-binding domain-containing protein [Oscillospiraceae bacterium]
FNQCTLCPRNCRANRNQITGFCGAGNKIKIARASLHFWEEPCISGVNGSGAVFFSGCNLQCCFCQNYQISSQNFGLEITPKRLAEIFLELQEQNAHNINLVTATHYLPLLIPALELIKHKLTIPVIYNTSSYEFAENLRMLDGFIDIYLPDFKFFSSQTAKLYANAPDYPEIAEKAISEMIRQTGMPVFDSEQKLLKKGCMIRHLVMPSHRHESIELLHFLAENFDKQQFLLSLMAQYTPMQKSNHFPELNRHVTKMEYDSVLKIAQNLGFSGYSQDKSSADSNYTPDFNLQGVIK